MSPDILPSIFVHPLDMPRGLGFLTQALWNSFKLQTLAGASPPFCMTWKLGLAEKEKAVSSPKLSLWHVNVCFSPTPYHDWQLSNIL